MTGRCIGVDRLTRPATTRRSRRQSRAILRGSSARRRSSPPMATRSARCRFARSNYPISASTTVENLRRNARTGRAAFEGLKNDDLRFKTWERDVRYETNAVVIAMRDVSGSMGEFEKYITRSFYFWMVRFLRTKYNHVRIVFITHHTEAKEVDENAFFNLGESGGTKVSSAYQLALEVIEERFEPSQWNIYPFHFSDGDNWGEVDNQRCLDLVNQL